ncbi:DUF1439 domain-containing protein [Vibrio japonicus]|uniref:DUF1439 domain-containing protein n=2 Tax=Vibrio japonicus TaxID=1824638 RepID=A0ABY5LBY1_9VIBR|nr:DUF1439 domain-containing protein [Vibrio japonicus]UUM29567.1 DUF1439 domain-containing protein [Vibrio japonicus]
MSKLLMIRKKLTMLALMFMTLVMGGCATYSISEQEMTKYLNDNANLNQTVGIENVMYAQVSVDDLEVKIGRADKDRVSVFANTSGKVQMLNDRKRELDIDLEFSAIPEYDKETGEIFLKSLRLEHFDERSQLFTPELKTLLKPAVSLIGYALSQQPVYKLDSAQVKSVLLKSASPNLVVKDNKLVIELFD